MLTPLALHAALRDVMLAQVSRHAAEGLIGIAQGPGIAAIVEVAPSSHLAQFVGLSSLMLAMHESPMQLWLTIFCVLQLNSETDFATKTEQFRTMVSTISSAALSMQTSGI